MYRICLTSEWCIRFTVQSILGTITDSSMALPIQPNKIILLTQKSFPPPLHQKDHKSFRLTKYPLYRGFSIERSGSSPYIWYHLYNLSGLMFRMSYTIWCHHSSQSNVSWYYRLPIFVKKKSYLKIAPASAFRFIEDVDRAWNVNPIHFNLECRYSLFCFNDSCICVEFNWIMSCFSEVWWNIFFHWCKI